MSAYQEAPAKKSSAGGWLFGCSIIAVVLLVLLIIGGYFAYQAFVGFMGDALRQGATQSVQGSELTEPEKEDLVAEIDRIHAAYEAGDIGLAGLTDLFSRAMNKGIIDYISLRNLHAREMEGVADESTSEAALQQIHRLGHGLFEGELRSSDVERALDSHFRAREIEQEEQFDPQSPGNEDFQRWELREPLTAEDVQELVDQMRTTADEAGVAENVDPPDPAAALREVTDQVINTE